MSPSEEDIRRARQNQQKDVLNDLSSHVISMKNKYKYSIKIEVCLDEYRPRYGEKAISHNFLEKYSEDLYYTYLGFKLYDNIIEDGWGWHYDDWDNLFSRNIYIHNDLVIIYQIYFKEEFIDECFPTTYIGSYLILFQYFLNRFYEEANYGGKLNIRIKVDVPEDSILCLEKKNSLSYNQLQIEPIILKKYNLNSPELIIIANTEYILGEFLRKYYSLENFRIKPEYRKALLEFLKSF